MTAWDERLSPAGIQTAARAAIEVGVLGTAPAAFLHDLDRLDAQVALLKAAFPPTALHCVAVKANPVVPLLAHFVGADLGLEAASREECHLALAAGCAPERVIYNSPAKTEDDLRFALDAGLYLNTDNPEELARIEALRPSGSTAPIGLRVNPQVGAGTIAATSVAGRHSKFGMPIEARGEILEAYARHPWLTGLHLHVGSQGTSLEQLVEACAVGWSLIQSIEQTTGRALRDYDIGGGLPWRYRDEDRVPTVGTYAEALFERVPGLRDGPRLVTELGRSLLAGTGWSISRIEYVKDDGQTLVTHLGADAFLRPAYMPEDWHHDMLVLGPDGALKEADIAPRDVAGPLCFGGDFLCRARPLARAEPGDHIVVRDAGAYTLSMWSRHCSRALPPVYSYRGDAPTFVQLFGGESAADVVRFWSR